MDAEGNGHGGILMPYFRLARYQYSPIVILPVIFGTAFAHYNKFSFNLFLFCLALAGSFFAHLSANTLNDIFDYLGGVDKIANDEIPENRGSNVCGSGILVSNQLSVREAVAAAIVFLSLALVCGVALAYLTGWFVILLAAVGFFFSFFYCAPPISFGYIGRGLGEIAIFASFGILPILGSYYVQAHTINWNVFLASLPFGFFATLVLYNHHFSHASADRKAKKVSPVVALGPKMARTLGTILIACTYASVVACVVIGIYPALSLFCLITLPFVFFPALKLNGSETCKESLQFLSRVVKTSLTSELILCLSLLF